MYPSARALSVWNRVEDALYQDGKIIKQRNLTKDAHMPNRKFQDSDNFDEDLDLDDDDNDPAYATVVPNGGAAKSGSSRGRGGGSSLQKKAATRFLACLATFVSGLLALAIRGRLSYMVAVAMGSSLAGIMMGIVFLGE